MKTDTVLVRIRKDYLEKLRKMATKDKRSMARQLEVLIDQVNQAK